MTELELRQDIKQKLPYLMQKLPSMDESELQQLHDMLDAVLEVDESATIPKKKRNLVGSMPDLVVYMADDFNDPLDDFKEYMPD